MPFIRGRYHINPVLGEAMEAAREAEAALAALENAAARDNDGGSDDVRSRDAQSNKAAKGPIHRVEIEAAELVPSHTGRAERGYVARVHRQNGGASDEVQDDVQDDSTAGNGDSRDASYGGAGTRALSGRGLAAAGSRAPAGARAETHVFADHRDLVSFLRDELAKDCAR